MRPSIVVVHTAGLAAGAPDPVDRQLLRRVCALAAVADVTLAVTEPQLGPLDHAALDDRGVRTVEVCAGLDEWLADLAASAVIATSTALGDRVRLARPDLPLVLDLAALPALELARVDAATDPAELPGARTMADHVGLRDRAVLVHAVLVAVPTAAVAREAEAIAPGATIVALAPSVPVRAPLPVPRSRRVGVVGRFASEHGLPAERALADVTSALGGSGIDVVAVGFDASILRRALAASGEPSSVRDLDAAVRDLRGAVVVAGDHAAVAELRGLGVAHVVHDHDDPTATADALRRLVTDDEWRRAAHERQRADAQLLHDPARSIAAWFAALAGAGVIDAATAAAPLGTFVEPQPTWRRRSVAGSLAAPTPATDLLRREAQPDALVPWQHALYTNLDLPPDVAYRRWLDVHHDVDSRRDVLAARAARIRPAPCISIVMPVHDTEPAMLRAAIDAVRAQIWPHWQLCIADDGTTSPITLAVLDEASANDERITVTRRTRAEGIAAATNRAIAMATGTFVAFVDHDDVITEDALLWIARAIDLVPDADLVYSDEDKLDEQGRRVEPFCKPDWSPDLLLSCNYITHLLAVRRALLTDIGGLRSGVDGAQDYDLLLRLAERTDRIVHIPKPLYSWRKSPTSTAADINAKPEAHAASRRAIDDAIARRGLDASRHPGIDPTWHRVRHRIRTRPTVTVIIPTRDRLELLAPCIDLVRQGVAHAPLEILVLDNESTDPATVAWLDAFDGRVVRYPHRFNYARQMNLAALEARGEVLLLLNNDARPVGTGWFDAMLEHALRPEVGAVGARLRFPDGRAQHEGVVLNAGGVALNLDAGPYAVLADNIRDVAAVTGACLMVRRGVWDAVAGMDEQLRVAYNDVDLCLRIGERGYRNVYTPLAELTHAESSSRGSLHPEVDEAYYQRRWGPPRTSADPFFTTAIELLHPFSPRL